MKHIIVLFSFLALGVGCSPPAKIATTTEIVKDFKGSCVTYNQVNLRTEPNSTSAVLSTIPSNTKLLISGASSNYYRINFHDTIGYVYRFLTKDYSQDTLIRVTPLNNSTSSTQTTNSSQGKIDNCSSVQCSGTTKKKERCRNRTTNCNGRCYLH